MSSLGYNRNKGFTLIELIMVIIIIGVLSVPAAYILMFFVQNSIYLPNQLNTDMVLADTLDLIINGGPAARGLRFSRALTSIDDNELTFVSQDGVSVHFRLDSGTGKLYRSLDGGSEALVPYYLPESVTFSGDSGAVFAYYDGNESLTSTAADVRRVGVSLRAKEGAGQFESWEGASQALTAVAVPRFLP